MEGRIGNPAHHRDAQGAAPSLRGPQAQEEVRQRPCAQLARTLTRPSIPRHSDVLSPRLLGRALTMGARGHYPIIISVIGPHTSPAPCALDASHAHRPSRGTGRGGRRHSRRRGRYLSDPSGDRYLYFGDDTGRGGARGRADVSGAPQTGGRSDRTGPSALLSVQSLEMLYRGLPLFITRIQL